MANRFFYTAEQIEFLRIHRPLKTMRELTKLFNETFNLKKPYNTLRSACFVYVAKVKPRRVYTTEQIDFVRRHRPLMTVRKLTELFNETFRKSASANCIERLCARHGIKGAHPIGTKVKEERYVRVKTDKLGTRGNHVWRGKHILLWEAAHGPVPEGERITFADGDRQNFSLDNLVKITTREAAYLNLRGLRFPDTELTKTAIGIARLRMAILDQEKAMGEQAPAPT